MVKYILLLLSFYSGCIFDDKLSIMKVENKSDFLKIDGVFLEESELSTCIYFLYKDGTILYQGCVNSSLIQNRLTEIRNNPNRKNEIKYLWGVYQISKDSTIVFEKWYPSEIPYNSAIRKGKIINDSTFIISELSDPNGKNKDYKYEIYILNKFHPKPDSTNIFIK